MFLELNFHSNNFYEKFASFGVIPTRGDGGCLNTGSSGSGTQSYEDDFLLVRWSTNERPNLSRYAYTPTLSNCILYSH